jgi:hypothetical protein
VNTRVPGVSADNPLPRTASICVWLNQRAGTPIKPENYEGVRFYWTPSDSHEMGERLNFALATLGTDQHAAAEPGRYART